MLNWLKKLPMFVQVLGGSIILLYLAIVIQPERESIDEQLLPWNAHMDEQGKLHALGLIIGESTVSDAMKLYGKDVEVKIFSARDESNKSLEAYFPAMYIGSIKAALALKIDVPESVLEEAYSNGKNTVINQNDKREVELYSADIAKFLEMPISSATLLPRKHLTERAIELRFGAPDARSIQSDNLEHLRYHKLGLDLILDAEGPEALQYSPDFAQ